MIECVPTNRVVVMYLVHPGGLPHRSQVVDDNSHEGKTVSNSQSGSEYVFELELALDSSDYEDLMDEYVHPGGLPHRSQVVDDNSHEGKTVSNSQSGSEYVFELELALDSSDYEDLMDEYEGQIRVEVRNNTHGQERVEGTFNMDDEEHDEDINLEPRSLVDLESLDGSI
ncbi:unnamed protein product [Ilex paraguariensis]|uniref:Uncharacterized protein n=1 Tax=Ilex paraguariensis TaxID=185542 RepID=A0ABC8TPI4_9AQUA